MQGGSSIILCDLNVSSSIDRANVCLSFALFPKSLAFTIPISESISLGTHKAGFRNGVSMCREGYTASHVLTLLQQGPRGKRAGKSTGNSVTCGVMHHLVNHLRLSFEWWKFYRQVWNLNFSIVDKIKRNFHFPDRFNVKTSTIQELPISVLQVLVLRRSHGVGSYWGMPGGIFSISIHLL